jgi:hypothetical protein
MPSLPCEPFINNIPNDQALLRTYNTGFAVQRIMFSRKVVLTIISLSLGPPDQTSALARVITGVF